MTSDMDMLPKGCSNMIQIDHNGVTQFYLPDILKTLRLTQAQFIDMCILMDQTTTQFTYQD